MAKNANTNNNNNNNDDNSSGGTIPGARRSLGPSPPSSEYFDLAAAAAAAVRWRSDLLRSGTKRARARYFSFLTLRLARASSTTDHAHRVLYVIFRSRLPYTPPPPPPPPQSLPAQPLSVLQYFTTVERCSFFRSRLCDDNPVDDDIKINNNITKCPRVKIPDIHIYIYIQHIYFF